MVLGAQIPVENATQKLVKGERGRGSISKAAFAVVSAAYRVGRAVSSIHLLQLTSKLQG